MINLIKEKADTEHRADKTHHREIKQGADCQKQQRSMEEHILRLLIDHISLQF